MLLFRTIPYWRARWMHFHNMRNGNFLNINCLPLKENRFFHNEIYYFGSISSQIIGDISDFIKWLKTLSNN